MSITWAARVRLPLFPVFSKLEMWLLMYHPRRLGCAPQLPRNRLSGSPSASFLNPTFQSGAWVVVRPGSGTGHHGSAWSNLGVTRRRNGGKEASAVDVSRPVRNAAPVAAAPAVSRPRRDSAVFMTLPEGW